MQSVIGTRYYGGRNCTLSPSGVASLKTQSGRRRILNPEMADIIPEIQALKHTGKFVVAVDGGVLVKTPQGIREVGCLEGPLDAAPPLRYDEALSPGEHAAMLDFLSQYGGGDR